VEEKLEILKFKIHNAENILITTHLNADGDAIGSSLALGLILKKMGKTVNVLTPNDFPAFLHWLPGIEMISVFRNDQDKLKEIIHNTDLIFCIDFNDPSRLEKAADVVFASSTFKILIDHHPQPLPAFDLQFTDTSYGSAAEYLYHLLKTIGLGGYIDKDIAECIFTGIMTDTGNFSYSCNYPEVWITVSELIKLGIDKNRIHSSVYDNYSEQRMKLLGYSLEKMKVFQEYNTAVISLSRDEMNKFNHQPGDTEGFVNLPFSIKNIKLTALFLEKNDRIKISFRSRGDFPVNKLSSEYFRGGGHMNAAGGEWDKPLDKAVERFIEVLGKYKEELKLSE
jgi:phosphoesterase RecJ-like protein